MNRILVIALSLSVISHLVLAVYFFGFRKNLPERKHGEIAVDFIQSVPHGIMADPHHHPGKKAKNVEPQNPPATATPPTSASAAGESGDPAAQARESDRYIVAVSQLINARKIYPRAAVEREEEGRVIIGVTLDREGHVVSKSLEEKSTFDRLNQAALDTIQAVGIFPPLPPEVPDPIHLHIPLVFKIENR